MQEELDTGEEGASTCLICPCHSSNSLDTITHHITIVFHEHVDAGSLSRFPTDCALILLHVPKDSRRLFASREIT